MSIANRIQAINDHLIDDYKVLRLAGVDLSGVNKNIVNLKMSWQERLLYFMNNGTDIVWNNWNKVTGTGTSVSINNTVEAPMSIVYKGNTSQSGTPTPSSPQDIHTVSGNNSIKIEGKNLFNKGTTNVLNAYINGSSVITSSASDRTYWLQVQKNTNYTIKMTQIALSTAQYVDDFQCGLFTTTPTLSLAGNRVFSRTRTSATENYTFTETFNSGNYDYLAIKVGNNTRTNITESLNTLQLEVGSTATTYQPYTSSSYPINLGVENLLNISSNLGRTTSNGITFVPVFNDDGTLKYISVNGTATATANMQLAGTQTLDGSYTLSSGIGINNNIYIQCLKTSDYTAALRTDLPYNTGTFSNVNVVTYLYVKNGTTANNVKIYPMLEKGLVEHSYNPYGRTPIELNKISTYQDYIFKNTPNSTHYNSDLTDNVWYKYSAIGKVVLNGSEAKWYTFGSVNYEYQSIISEGYTGSDYKSSYSNRYANNNVSGANLQNYQYSCFIQNGEMYVRFRHNDITTLENYKTWLGSNNVTVYYILATPTYDKITDTSLIQQLETIKYSYNSQTNISQVNNDLPFVLDVLALEEIN